jgi:hypothetical protein
MSISSPLAVQPMLREIERVSCEPTDAAGSLCADRIGLARLARMAFAGADLHPLWQTLTARLIDGTAEAGDGLDLSLIAQLLGDGRTGLAIQREVLGFHQLYRSPCAVAKPRLRVLALAAATDTGGNTPIEFLLEESGIELMTLYVIPEIGIPALLPDHDVAIVIASDREGCRDALRQIDLAASRWPQPLLNPPHLLDNLDRGGLHRLLSGIEGLEIPTTAGVGRAQLLELSCAALAPADIATELAFPLIVWPCGLHAAGPAKIDDRAGLARYLGERQEQEFFISRFVDYSDSDGLFRKYRVVFVDSRPYACDMAIADRWDISYPNAAMPVGANACFEEEAFLRDFDVDFARRHAAALAGIASRIGLEYFILDCAENEDGELLVFEANNTAVIHNMETSDVVPYRPLQMRRIFGAFAAMLCRHARRGREQAA